MLLEAHPGSLSEIKHLRALFLQEANTQIRYNSVHDRGWSDTYILTIDRLAVGYGSLRAQDSDPRDTIFEYYIIPPYRGRASQLFKELILASHARYIECQSNVILLPSLIFDYSDHVSSNVILFSDHALTHLRAPEFVFRKRKEDDLLFEHRHEPEGNYVIEFQGEIIATGGFFLHYNFPFSDLYMEVKETFRRRGAGSYLIQEIKRECYLSGRIPAARCGRENPDSKATLLKAGLQVAGCMLLGNIK